MYDLKLSLGDYGPGPGAYSIPSTVGSARGGPTLKGRLAMTARQYTPGPGAYNAEKPQKTLRYSMGARHKGSSTIYASSSTCVNTLETEIYASHAWETMYTCMQYFYCNLVL